MIDRAGKRPRRLIGVASGKGAVADQHEMGNRICRGGAQQRLRRRRAHRDDGDLGVGKRERKGKRAFIRRIDERFAVSNEAARFGIDAERRRRGNLFHENQYADHLQSA